MTTTTTYDSEYGLNGYLSELYFVNNQALGPDAFGESINNGTWVPKDNTVIKATINAGPVSPYAERANTSQVWSNGIADNDPGNPGIYGFNSDDTTTLAFDR